MLRAWARRCGTRGCRTCPRTRRRGRSSAVEGSAAFEPLIRDKDRLAKLADEEQQGGLLAAWSCRAWTTCGRMRIRTLAQRAAADLFNQYDALVGAGDAASRQPGCRRAWTTTSWAATGAWAVWAICVGLPALCVPMGFGPGHLPLGLQFVGAAYDEATLLALGMAFQQATDWHRQRPPAPFGA